ncbi:MAG: hypothetical protein KA319_09725 [Ferruginibacter sp.]|nr:hypothetical protein [Ferruginibacter sp.]
MKKLIPVILVLLYSCNNKENKPQQPITPTNDSTQILQTPSGATINLISNYQVTDTANDYILFPLQVADAKDKEESSSLFSKRSGEGGLYWNVIFHNYKTNQSTLLEPNKKILIGGYTFQNSYYGRIWKEVNAVDHIETSKKTPFIFYSVYTDDYNGDKILSTDDPAYFFISNADGTGFRQVSPPNISITDKSFPKNNSYLLLEGIKDSNNDKKFNADDEKVFYRVDMADSAFKVQEVFSPAFKVELKKLFDKNWKK